MTAPISSQNLYGSEASAAEQSRMELQAKLNGLGGINGRKLDPEAKAAKLREACEGFESIFIQKMWQEMRNSVPKAGILTGREERYWQDMYDQELSKSMTKAGGIGLADMMYEQLSRNLVSASRSAAGSVQGAAFAPGAAPLVPDADDDLIDPPSLRAESIYENVGAEQGFATMPAIADSQTGATAAASVSPAATLVPPLTTMSASATTEAQKLAANPYTAAPNTVHARSEHKAADFNQAGGMAMAQQAMRDAGDKLGSRAVRPARQPRPAQPETVAQQNPNTAANTTVAPLAANPTGTPVAENVAGINQSGMAPGSPEAIRAAMEKAKVGQIDSETAAPLNLKNLVANVQAQGQMQAQAQLAAEANAAAPGIVRVRRTTNTPQKSSNKTAKKPSQAIRMLNVDNVGVNSRQGQGLSAYKAQQDMASQPVPAALAPLAATSAPNQTSVQEGGAAIPPLTATDVRL